MVLDLAQEYVKDLYIIGLILVFTPPVLGIIGLLMNIDLEDWVYLFVCGVLITSYVSFKYHYEPRKDKYIAIPAWVILIIIIAIIALYLWWRFL